MSKFLSTYHAKKIVKQKNCFKNSDRPTCTDLIMTHSSRSFQDTCTVETGLLNFLKSLLLSLNYIFRKKNQYSNIPRL